MEVYTQEFKVKKQVCKDCGVLPGWHTATARIVATLRSLLINFDKVEDKKVKAKLTNKTQANFINALYLNRLNHTSCEDIKR